MRVDRLGDDLAVRLPAEAVERLGLKEGDELTVRVMGAGRIGIERRMSREEALEALRKLSWPAPPGFRFDREEANRRGE